MRMAVRTGQWQTVIAKREMHMTAEQKRKRIAQLHGRTRAESWDMLMDRWLTIAVEYNNPREALKLAYRRGYLAGNSRLYRREKKNKQAAA